MAIKGIFTSDSNIPGDRVGDFASTLISLFPDGDFPFFKMSAGMKKETATDAIITWFEQNYVNNEVSTDAAGYTASVTTINVDDGSLLRAGDIIENQTTAEYMYITAVVTNALTVVRGFAGTTASAITAAVHKIQKITNAYEEASSKPESITYLGQPMTNYTQIFRTAWGISRSAKQTAFRTGNPLPKTKSDASWQHAVDIERAALWGRKSWGVKNDKPFHTTDGILSQIKTNVTAAGGTTNKAQFEDFLQAVFKNNIKGQPNERLCFLSNNALRVINDIVWAQSKLQFEVTSATDTFGMNIRRWLSPFGSISFMTHPLMNSGTKASKDMYLIHPAAVTKKVMQDTTIETYDNQGVDGEFGGFLSEMGFIYAQELTGGKLTGLTAGA